MRKLNDWEKLTHILAELVAWDGSEDRESYCQRLQTAEDLLKKLAPEVLKEAVRLVKAHNSD